MQDVALTDVGTAAVAALFALAAFLGIVWFVLPYAASRPCPLCGAPVGARAQACPACGAPPPQPPEAHPGAAPYGFAEPARAGNAPGVVVEGGQAYNRGMTRRVVTVATAAMGLGVGIRIVGMAGALGLPQVPPFIDGALTVVGGLVAFVGFVFLDAA